MAQDGPGYDDTPVIPGSKWKVHDQERPYPPVVTPPTADVPPSDAVMLFDGTDLSHWEGNEGRALWRVENGYLEVVPGSGNIRTREGIGDCQLHIEWAAPAKVESRGQGRGNSGVFLMDRYEIQVLDSYDNPTYADGSAASVYGEFPPLVNACRKPGEWQTYDIVWFGPRFDGDRLVRPARLTMLHNGILVHHNTELVGPTRHKRVNPYVPHPEKAPLRLQDHRNPVRYRNIWYRPLVACPR
jgi:hypothetical protein